MHAERLDIRTEHYKCDDMDIAFINSKGFGGNNATATVISPSVTMQMLSKRHGEHVMSDYAQANKSVQSAQAEYQQQADLGSYELIYRFGDGMIDENEIVITDHDMQIPGFDKAIELSTSNPYQDMF